jgi:biotin transport system substrate-specific component
MLAMVYRNAIHVHFWNAQMSLTTRELVHVALLTALMIVFAVVPPVPVPVLPVPITLQTFGVMLAGLLLAPRLAALAMVLYVVLAMIGLPILPGGRGGLAVLVGPTGGFLLGFIPGAWVTSWLSRQTVNPLASRQWVLRLVAAWVGGCLVVYAVGVPWLAMVTGMTFSKAALAVVVFLPGDVIKAILATVVMSQVARWQVLRA